MLFMGSVFSVCVEDKNSHEELWWVQHKEQAKSEPKPVRLWGAQAQCKRVPDTPGALPDMLTWLREAEFCPQLQHLSAGSKGPAPKVGSEAGWTLE